MRANAEITMKEGIAEMNRAAIAEAIDSAAMRVAEVVVRLLSCYLVYCFGLPRDNFKSAKENQKCRSVLCSS
jgi:hypothetical protein